MSAYRRWLRISRRERDLERELDEELDAHIEMRAAAFERRGMSPAEARAEARRRLGDRRALRASMRAREVRLSRAEWWDGFRRDLGLALRRAARAPGATLLSVLTFALGIGLTTSGFAVVDRVLLRALPYPSSDRLVALEGVDSTGTSVVTVAAASWRVWRENSELIEASALHWPTEFTLVVGDGAYRVAGQEVVGEFFETIGSGMRLGRAFTETEIESGVPYAVVSERFWRNRLGSPTGFPLQLMLDGATTTVTGVVAHGHGYPLWADVWVGTVPSTWESGLAHTWINHIAIARLAPGVTPEQLEAELAPVAREIRAANPAAIYSYGVAVRPLRDQVVGESDRYLLLLLGAVSFVLLITCANLGGLGLARAAARKHEMSVRTSLGAGRSRLVRQLLTEHVAIALVGGALGVALSWFITRIVAARGGAFIPRAPEIAVDWRILLFAFAVSLLAGAAAGLLPALRASAVSLRSTLAGGRGHIEGGRGTPGAVLVAVEVAVALTLVTGGGLLVRSFQTLMARDLGFRPDGVVIARITLTPERYDEPEQRILYWTELLDRARALPDVEYAAVARHSPGSGGGSGFIEVTGDATSAARTGAGYRVVSDDYFELLGIPIIAGRGFEPTDGVGTPRVAVVNESMARRYWNGDAVGERVRAISMEILEGQEWITVIGVARDVRHFGHRSDIEPEMYVLYRQVATTWADDMEVVLRAREGAALQGLASGIRRIVREQDAEIAVEVATLDAQLGELEAERRFVMSVLSGFAFLALILAAIGLYGMLSFAVARRTHEIGIRAVLGADRNGILGMVLGSVVGVVGVGLAAGLAATLWLTRLMRSLLVDIGPHDPLSFLASIAVLLIAALLAALLPALRATRVDPLDALRSS